MLELNTAEITGVGWFGIMLGFSAVFLMTSRQQGVARVGMMFFLAILQIITAIYFYQWALSNTTDAITYYTDPYDWYARGFGLNTGFIIWIVQWTKSWAGGTYLDYFLLFQAAGTWGIAFVLLTFDEIFEMAEQPPYRALYLTMLLPGVHFWTAYIGKDGLLFLAAALTTWAALQIGKRWLAFGFAVVLMILVRPHIAILALAACAIGVALDKKTSSILRLSLIFMSLVAFAVAAMTIRDTFRIDVTSADSVTDFLASYSETTQRVSGGTAAYYDSYLVRVFSLLFRPLFFDASGVLGIIASFENLFWLFMVGTLIYRFGWVVTLFKHLFVVRYAALFAVALTILLSLMYYNVGLGLRQKIMMMPAYLTLLAAVLATARRVKPAARRPRPQPA